MNRTIHPTTIQQRPVGGIHNGVDLLQADISNKDVTMATHIRSAYCGRLAVRQLISLHTCSKE